MKYFGIRILLLVMLLGANPVGADATPLPESAPQHSNPPRIASTTPGHDIECGWPASIPTKYALTKDEEDGLCSTMPKDWSFPKKVISTDDLYNRLEHPVSKYVVLDGDIIVSGSKTFESQDHPVTLIIRNSAIEPNLILDNAHLTSIEIEDTFIKGGLNLENVNLDQSIRLQSL